MSDEVKLLPCAFCGGEGLMHRVPWGWQVTCHGCGAAPRNNSNANRETEAGAAAVWNTRAIEATRPTEQDLGVPFGPGHSRAEPEEVSVVPTSVPNAMWPRERAERAVAAVRPEARENAFRRLQPYNGVTNSWGSRGALLYTSGFLRGAYEKARCDSSGVSDCFRCQTMLLVRTIEELLAASAIEASGQDGETRLDAKHESAGPKDDAHE